MSDVIQATGRRKRAIARVSMTLGQGLIRINDKPVEAYFPRPQLLQIVRQPLEATQSLSRFDVTVKAGVVTMKGRVHDEKAKEKATKVAKGVKGVVSVTNELKVFGQD